MRKLAPARVSYRDDFLISYRVYMMTGSFHISLFEGTLHVDKIHVWFKIANITHALPVPVYRQTDFTPKRVVVSRLHDTAASFRTGVKFSPRCKNRGELTPGWLAPAWHFVVVSCKQIWSHERQPEWTRSGAKVALVSCKHLFPEGVAYKKRITGKMYGHINFMESNLLQAISKL